MINKKWAIRQRCILLLKLSLALTLIIWLIQSRRFELTTLHKLKSPWIWIYGVTLFSGVLAINARRWQILLKLQGVPVPYGRVFCLSLIGLFFNFFIPGGGVGGDLVKAGYLMRSHKTMMKWVIGWSVLVDRVLGVSALLFYSALTGLLFHSQLESNLQPRFFFLSLGILSGFFIFILLLLFIPGTKMDRFLHSHSMIEKTLLPLFFFFQKPGTMLVPFLLSLISQALLMGLGVCLVVFLNPGLPPWMIFLIFPFGFLATVLPISPAGVGVGQAAFYYLFEKITDLGNFGVLTITFVQAVQFLVALAGGFLFVTYMKKEETQKK